MARPFLQPLALALVCIVFISLVLTMGLVDLRTLDNTLAGYMRDRGLAIIRNVHQVAEHHFQRLTQSQMARLEVATGPSISDEDFSLQESLIINLVELAREIDSEWETGKYSSEQLAFFAAREELRLIAFVNDQGIVTYKSRVVPSELLGLVDAVVRGREEIKVNIYNRGGSKDGLGFIALRRKSGRGTIILALDHQNIVSWSLRLCIQKAIYEVGQSPDTFYFIVQDQAGRTLGQAGEMLEGRREKPEIVSTEKDTSGVVSRKIILAGQHVLEIEAPISFGKGFAGVARVGLKRERADQGLKKEQGRLLVSMGFLVVITFISMWLLYKNQNRHLARMQEIERQLHQAERLSALGRLAAGVAHEIRNPLNAISMASQRLQRNNPDQLTSVIRDEISRLNRIIEEFLIFSKSRKLEFGHHDLIELLGQIVLLINEEADSRGIKVLTRGDYTSFIVLMDFDKLKQAIFNIVKNAMESISGKGSVTLSVEPERKGWISLKILDTGSGLTANEIEQIFNPDYTTKEKGLGLGLPLAYEIIRGHGGEVKVWSKKGSGTSFEILLPGSEGQER